MLYKKNLSSQNCFKFIYTLTTVVGQTPGWNFDKNSPKERAFVFKLYVLCLYAILIVINALKINETVKRLKSMVLYFIVTKTCMVTLQMLVIVYYCWSQKWKDLMIFLVKSLHKRNGTDYKICVQFLIGNFLFLIPFVGQIYFSFRNISWNIYTIIIFLISLSNEYFIFLNGCTIFSILWVFNKNYLHLKRIY